jgi:hypothetical protein
VEHIAHIDAARDEFGARRHDVGDDEIESLRRAGCGGRDSLAKVDRARRARRRELHGPKRVTDDEVGVEPPAQAAVEALGSIDVGHRDDDGLELQVHRVVAAHRFLLGLWRHQGRASDSAPHRFPQASPSL